MSRLACVIGSSDVVRPLVMAGVRCAVVAPPRDPARLSRHVAGGIDRMRPGVDDDLLVERLLALAAGEPEPPVLYPCTDRDLIFVSRHRDDLAPAFVPAVADARLVERLVDKSRFIAEAERLGLPVPRSTVVPAGTTAEPAPCWPAIVKPVDNSAGTWRSVTAAKAVAVADAPAWRALARQLSRAGADVVVQELVEGPETAIESYHVYVDGRGDRAGEFTGRKIRTIPRTFGNSTAVEITQQPDVQAAGRRAVRAFGLTGVAKVDFKRDARGDLHLLEINPRFNLWHHAGAVAGVNLPALAHADLSGIPRPSAGRARAGVRWCDPTSDPAAARAHGISRGRWLAWAIGCDAASHVSLDDPRPFVGGVLVPRLRVRARRVRVR